MIVMDRLSNPFIIFVILEILTGYYYNSNYTEIKENLMTFALYTFALCFNIINLGLFFPRKGIISNELYPVF